MIVCLGWGSLIWNPDGLPLVDPRPEAWRDDGPELPIEFARVSGGGRLTLVLGHEFSPVRVLWNELSVTSMSEAVQALRRREGTKTSWIGRWSKHRCINCQDSINDWAQSQALDGIVWSAMPSKFEGEEGRWPTQAEAVAYLESLTGETRERAKEYVSKAPSQIDTPYRREFASRLGWV